MEKRKRGLESLEVWQRARSLALAVCRDIVPGLPEVERWSLAIQIRRSAQSIPANIAEGFGRYYYQEGVRFCYLARGSLDELWSHLRLAADLGYLTELEIDQIATKIEEVRRLLNGYIAFLRRSKRGAGEPGGPAIQEVPAKDFIEP
jgi:four helix bundle protein